MDTILCFKNVSKLCFRSKNQDLQHSLTTMMMMMVCLIRSVPNLHIHKEIAEPPQLEMETQYRHRQYVIRSVAEGQFFSELNF